MKFGVITSVPAQDDLQAVVGNVAWCGPVYVVQGKNDDHTDRLGLLSPLQMLSIRTPVFDLGEVLICDNDGREMFGRGRKPSKWAVEVEWFDDLPAAIERAERMLRPSTPKAEPEATP